MLCILSVPCPYNVLTSSWTGLDCCIIPGYFKTHGPSSHLTFIHAFNFILKKQTHLSIKEASTHTYTPIISICLHHWKSLL